MAADMRCAGRVRDVRTTGLRALARRPSREPVAAASPLGRRGRREDHPARRLVDHVLGHLSDEVVARPAGAAEQRAAAHRASAPRPRARSPRRRAGAPPPRSPGRRAARAPWPWPPRRPRTPPPPPWPARSAARAALSCSSGRRGVERQRHRHLEHPERLDHARRPRPRPRPPRRPGAPRSGRCRRRAASPKIGTRIEPYSTSRRLGAQRLLGDRHAPEHRLALGEAVDDVERDPGDHPAEADAARARWRTSTLIQPAIAISAPSTAGSGSEPPRDRDADSGTR